jgi:hypothetical protein
VTSSTFQLNLKHDNLPRFDTLIRCLAINPNFAEHDRPFLRNITQPYAEAIPLLKLLWRERLTTAHLMPNS